MPSRLSIQFLYDGTLWKEMSYSHKPSSEVAMLINIPIHTISKVLIGYTFKCHDQYSVLFLLVFVCLFLFVCIWLGWNHTKAFHKTEKNTLKVNMNLRRWMRTINYMPNQTDDLLNLAIKWFSGMAGGKEEGPLLVGENAARVCVFSLKDQWGFRWDWLGNNPRPPCPSMPLNRAYMIPEVISRENHCLKLPPSTF